MQLGPNRIADMLACIRIQHRTLPCTTPRRTHPPLTVAAEAAGANCPLTSSHYELERILKEWMVKAMKMQSRKRSMSLDAPLIYPALLLLILFALSLFAVDSPAATDGAATQVTFATPSEAGQALQAANEANDEVELRDILGPDSQDVVGSGDPTEDQAARQSFVTKYDQMSRWVTMSDGSQVLYIGADNYPFPIPLAKKSEFAMVLRHGMPGKKRFLRAASGEMNFSRWMRASAIVDAEHEYYQTAHNGSPAHQYTSRIVSTAGKQDGLYWPASASQATQSPRQFSPSYRSPRCLRSSPGQPFVLDGYILRIVTGARRRRSRRCEELHREREDDGRLRRSCDSRESTE